jgi:2-isopropylmalate synthase
MKPQDHPTDENSDVGDVAAERLRIFDTTLRDGEQAPGFSMDRRAKLRMAHALEALGVDILEAGFPSASPDDFASVAEIARVLRSLTVCGLARCHDNDIDACGRALESAQHSRIHLFLSTSPLHREHKLNMSKQQVIDTACAAIERAKQQCHEVEFSAEDAMRTEPEYRPSPRVPPPSTRRIPWVTPRPPRSPSVSPTCASMCAAPIRWCSPATATMTWAWR